MCTPYAFHSQPWITGLLNIIHYKNHCNIQNAKSVGTIWLSNIAMENGLFLDDKEWRFADLPIKNGNVPILVYTALILAGCETTWKVRHSNGDHRLDTMEKKKKKHQLKVFKKKEKPTMFRWVIATTTFLSPYAHHNQLKQHFCWLNPNFACLNPGLLVKSTFLM